MLVKCDHCGKDTNKLPYQLKSAKHIYCSIDCKQAARKNGRSVECLNCKKEVYRTEYHLSKNLTGEFFCSNACKSKYHKRAYVVECVICSKQFEKVPADQKRYPVHCCSIECRSEYNDRRELHCCDECGKEFNRPPSVVAGKTNLFCSQACHDKFQDAKVELVCEICSKKFRVSPVYAKRNEHHFCSNDCKGKFVVNGKVFESEFEKLAAPLGVNFIKNDRLTLMQSLPHRFPNKTFALELDFYFPDLRFAVEINGPPHFVPIYGLDPLRKRQIRDRRKKRLCKEAGIKLRTVKVDSPYIEDTIKKFKRVIWEIRNACCNTN
jgi:YHS domain-containing protein